MTTSARIDLHLHSTASDGYLSPCELMRFVQENGVTLCSLTDHDTLDGVAEAIAEADRIGLRCIPGIELSCLIETKSVHLLAYFNRVAPPLLVEKLAEIQRWRAERNPKMVAKLQALGFSITMDQVASEAGGGQIGRPHIARVLLQQGAVKTIDEAFEKFLTPGKPAYVEKDRLFLKDAVKLVHDAGGIAVLAHPLVYNFMQPTLLKWLVNIAIEAKIDGVEAFYTDHRQHQRKAIEQLTQEAGLLVSGGSDFHGPINGLVKPGIGYGDLKIPDYVGTVFTKRIEALPK